MNLGLDPLHKLHGLRIESDLAGKIDGLSGAHRLRIGADRLWRIGGRNDLIFHRAPVSV
jgi:hypothetical protein